jgi:hypothetical protein
MQRVRGGGNAVRAVACLPALVGAWRDPRGRRIAVVVGHLSGRSAALERPDLIRGTPRTINMSAIGDALVDAGSAGARDLRLQLESVAWRRNRRGSSRGFARDDLFCVVHEIFQTDTADYADILLPATTQLEQIDIHSSYGHLYALANNQAIAPLGEALPNTEVFRRLARAMGFDEPCFRDTDDDARADGVRRDDRARAGWTGTSLKRDGWQRLTLPASLCAVRAGQLPHAVGQMRVLVREADGAGRRPAAGGILPRESAATNPALAQRYPLALHLAAGAQLPQLVVRELCPSSSRRRRRRGSRSIPTTRRARARHGHARAHFQRSRLVHRPPARVTRPRAPGVVVAPSIWWRKLAPGGENANAVTSQALTDLGRAATF